MKVTELASAKINLTLDVGAKRADGYHEISTIMQTIGLQDTLTLERGTGEGIRLLCDAPGIPCDSTNLVWRAAEVFFRETGIACDGLTIQLEKRIPSQAGLGGGSSDAAATLRGLRQLYCPELTDRQLEEMGAQVGSDVPFCVRGGAMLACGRGEKLQSLAPLPSCWVVVCKPEASCATGQMYQKLDEMQFRLMVDTDEVILGLIWQDLDRICTHVGNQFFYAVPRECGTFEIESILMKMGAKCATLSGSGSAMFGIFSDEAAARLAAEELKKRYPDTFLTQPV